MATEKMMEDKSLIIPPFEPTDQNAKMVYLYKYFDQMQKDRIGQLNALTSHGKLDHNQEQLYNEMMGDCRTAGAVMALISSLERDEIRINSGISKHVNEEQKGETTMSTKQAIQAESLAIITCGASGMILGVVGIFNSWEEAKQWGDEQAKK